MLVWVSVGNAELLLCLDFRIILERNTINFFICLKFHIHNSLCQCNNWKSVPAKPFPLALIWVQFLQKYGPIKSRSVSTNYLQCITNKILTLLGDKISFTPWSCCTTRMAQGSLCFPTNKPHFDSTGKEPSVPFAALLGQWAAALAQASAFIVKTLSPETGVNLFQAES